jgi:hypothetical protein
LFIRWIAVDFQLKERLNWAGTKHIFLRARR